MLRVYGSEYVSCDAAFVIIASEYMRGYKETYVPAYNALRAQDDGFMYLVTTDHMVTFVEGVDFDVSHSKAVDAEMDAFSSGNIDIVELPRELYKKLTEVQNTIRGYGYASIDDEGVHWTLNEKHTGVTLETCKLPFAEMEKAFERRGG
jgi:hypothetical protein